MYVYEGFDDAKTKAIQVLFQVQIKTKKTKPYTQKTILQNCNLIAITNNE